MKNTRKLIPAIAMLLVSAVMLSTATFAWFTATDKVTATGVQIRAEAAGSLLISKAPITATSGEYEVTADNTNLTDLMARTYYGTIQGAQLADEDMADGQEAGWYKPFDGFAVNSISGVNAGAYASANEASYYISEEFYIACAGEAKSGQDLKIELSSPVHPATGETHKAYAAAIYVIPATSAAWANNKDVADHDGDDDLAPAAIIFVDDAEGRNIYSLENIDIPTVVGADENTPVGIKLRVHFYVDGALASTDGEVTINNNIYELQTAGDDLDTNAKYFEFVEVDLTGADSATGYYTIDDNGAVTAAFGAPDADETYYAPQLVTPGNDVVTAGKIPTDAEWYTLSVEPETVNYAFIRSNDVALDGSTLKLTFESAAHD